MGSWGSPAQMARIQSELGRIMALALPAIVQSSTTMAMTATDQIMVGHLGRDALAAASVGNTWYNLLFYFQIGFGTALDTLASQAFGAGNSTGLWSATMTGVLMNVGAAVPMIAGLLGTAPVAQYLFAQPQDIAQQTAAFCVRLVPGVLPQILGLLLLKVLQAQNEMLAPAMLGIAGFLVNIGMNFLFIRAYGFLGAPIATTASRVVYLLGSIAILARSLHCQRRDAALATEVGNPCGRRKLELSEEVEAWKQTPPMATEASETLDASSDTIPLAVGSAHTSQDRLAGVKKYDFTSVVWGQAWRESITWNAIWTYLKLAIPGGCMVAMEAGSFDITTMMAGTLGVAQVDAHVALLTVNAFAFVSFPFGIATAATIRVGNLLGAKQPKLAALSAWCAVGCGGLSMLMCALVVVLLRDSIGLLFINDAEVARLVASIAPIGAFLMFFDGLMGTSQGALRGLGQQVKIMLFNATGFWGVGVSTGAVLTFYAHWGLRGVWTGITMGVTATCLLNLIGLLRVDWQHSSEQASSTSIEPGAEQSGPPSLETTDKNREAQCGVAQGRSWLGGVWDSAKDRVLGGPSRREYSLVGSGHEMKAFVVESCDDSS